MVAGCSSQPPEPKEIARVPYSDGHCILRDDGMVLIETPNGRDMLPVYLVSQELVDKFTAQLEAKESSK
jgi:hypothetical protein